VSSTTLQQFSYINKGEGKQMIFEVVEKRGVVVITHYQPLTTSL